MAADVRRAEAGIPSAEVAVVATSVVAAEVAVAEVAVVAIPVAGGTLAEAIDKFETFERVEVSCKLL